MLSILYILHHCNMLQSPGGHFPHHVLLPACCRRDGTAHTTCASRSGSRDALPSSRMAAQAEQHLSPSPSPARHPQHGEKGDKAIAMVAFHITKLFLVIQRRPEISFPLCSTPFHSQQSIRTWGQHWHWVTTTWVQPPDSISPGLSHSLSHPYSGSVLGGVTEQTEFNQKSPLKLNQDKISLA